MKSTLEDKGINYTQQEEQHQIHTISHNLK